MTYIGKIQYLQEKQGFIRCSQKIEGKRDIIFFIEESHPSVIKKLKLGLKVLFTLKKGNTTNVKGGKISHWAEIVDEYIDDSCHNDESSSSSESLVLSENECSFNPFMESSNYDSRKRIMSDLLSDVYKNLHNVTLATPEKGRYCNCWQITEY